VILQGVGGASERCHQGRCAGPRGGSRLEVVAVYVSSDFVQDRRWEDGGELGASAGISYAGEISPRVDARNTA
jgi:hypothetical protein